MAYKHGEFQNQTRKVSHGRKRRPKKSMSNLNRRTYDKREYLKMMDAKNTAMKEI